MERKPDIETRINEALESAKRIKPVDVPVNFTDDTMNRLHASKKGTNGPSYSGLLKIAAVIALLVTNAYTIQYILSGNQEALTDNTTVENTASVKDMVNDYQPSDASDLTFDEKLSK